MKRLISMDKFPQYVAITNIYYIVLPVLLILSILSTIFTGMELWSECSQLTEVNSSLLLLPEEVFVERGWLWVHIILFVVPTAIPQIHRAKACGQRFFCCHCKGPVLTEEYFVDPSTDFLWTGDFFSLQLLWPRGLAIVKDYEILWIWRTKHGI